MEQAEEQMYTPVCCLCGADSRLQMFPHRNLNTRMVGFLFVCPRCWSYVAGKSMSPIQFYDETGEDGTLWPRPRYADSAAGGE